MLRMQGHSAVSRLLSILPVVLVGLLLGTTSHMCLASPAAGEESPAAATAGVDEHPLARLLRLAAERRGQSRETINDYTCEIVKRERIERRLQEHQFISARVRPAVIRDGKVERPYAVHLRFRGPKDIAGREVIYVDGQNDGKMRVRRGGQRLGGVTLDVAVDSEVALRESVLPITEVCLEHMADDIRKALKAQIKLDPTGENTRVEILENASVDKRPCTQVRITHPRRQEELGFHIANVFVDKEWKMPTRLETYDWPRSEGGEPILTGEFTFTDLKINVGLPDADFDFRRLER